jgi:hypothetical protein
MHFTNSQKAKKAGRLLAWRRLLEMRGLARAAPGQNLSAARA